MRTMRQMQAAAKWDTGFAKPESEPPVRSGELVRRRPNAMLTTKELSESGVTRIVMPDIASQYDKMEDCILFLRVNKLISEGDVSRIRRRMEAKMAKPSNAKVSDGGD